MGKISPNRICDTVSFRVTRDEKNAIEALARRHRLSVSKYMRGKVYMIFETELLAFLKKPAGSRPDSY